MKCRRGLHSMGRGINISEGGEERSGISQDAETALGNNLEDKRSESMVWQ
jgi:hypothetical protein